jgi:hypothetical protein
MADYATVSGIAGLLTAKIALPVAKYRPFAARIGFPLGRTRAARGSPSLAGAGPSLAVSRARLPGGALAQEDPYGLALDRPPPQVLEAQQLVGIVRSISV